MSADELPITYRVGSDYAAYDSPFSRDVYNEIDDAVKRARFKGIYFVKFRPGAGYWIETRKKFGLLARWRLRKLQLEPAIRTADFALSF
jgi:hypothetical protein